MDSWTARKRPWEESSPIDVPLKRRDSTDDTPSLPQHADHYPRDSQSLSQRRLPPLYTSSYMPPTAFHTSSTLQLSSLAHEAVELDNSRPRSQSLFDLFQPPKRLRRDSDFGKDSSCIRSSLSCLAASLYELLRLWSAFPNSMGDCHDTPNRVSYSQLNMITERTTTFSGALDLHSSLPPIGRDASRPRFGTDPVQAQAHACCSSDCEGQACSSARILMRKLASELILLDTRVRSISEKDYHLPNDVSLSPL
jgi:hypothetical protein